MGAAVKMMGLLQGSTVAPVVVDHLMIADFARTLFHLGRMMMEMDAKNLGKRGYVVTMVMQYLVIRLPMSIAAVVVVATAILPMGYRLLLQ
jgi:hypothetical protein